MRCVLRTAHTCANVRPWKKAVGPRMHTDEHRWGGHFTPKASFTRKRIVAGLVYLCSSVSIRGSQLHAILKLPISAGPTSPVHGEASLLRCEFPLPLMNPPP